MWISIDGSEAADSFPLKIPVLQVSSDIKEACKLNIIPSINDE